MKWTEGFECTNDLEDLIKDIYSERMKEDSEFCRSIWSALANVIWVNPKDKQKFSTSFRSAGSFIAEVRKQGDYMDWYCCGEYSTVSSEIKRVLKWHGWIPYTYEGKKL